MRVAVCCGVALLAWAQAASAQVAPNAARVSWVNATQAADGSAIPATGPGALKQTRMQRSINCTASAFGQVEQTINVTPEVLAVLFENLTVGTHCFRARHVAHGMTAAEELLSDWSAVVQKIVAPQAVRPRPPVITIE